MDHNIPDRGHIAYDLVFDLMAQGMSNQSIDDELYLAAGTVKNNVSSIIGKLHANDMTQAVLAALRKGIVDLGEDQDL